MYLPLLAVGVSLLATLVQAQQSACVPSVTTPTPTGSVCNVPGKVKRPVLISTTVLTSAGPCRDQCLATANCMSFTSKRIDAYSVTCKLYSGSSSSMRFKKKTSSTTFFFDRDCFSNCPLAASFIVQAYTNGSNFNGLFGGAGSNDGAVLIFGFNTADYSFEIDPYGRLYNPQGSIATIPTGNDVEQITFYAPADIPSGNQLLQCSVSSGYLRCTAPGGYSYLLANPYGVLYMAKSTAAANPGYFDIDVGAPHTGAKPPQTGQNFSMQSFADYPNYQAAYGGLVGQGDGAFIVFNNTANSNDTPFSLDSSGRLIDPYGNIAAIDPSTPRSNIRTYTAATLATNGYEAINCQIGSRSFMYCTAPGGYSTLSIQGLGGFSMLKNETETNSEDNAATSIRAILY